MRISLRFLISVFLFGLTAPVFAQSSNCEIVLLPEGGSAEDGSFVDAEAFLDTIYDDEDGYIKTSGDVPIRAVMCVREDIIPTMRDLPIIETGLPFSLSQDFDSNSSGLLTLYDTGEEFIAQYDGPDLSQEDEEKLRDRLEIFNLQKPIK